MAAILLLCAGFQHVDDEKQHKKLHRYVPLLLPEQTLAQLQHPVASSEALDLLYWAMHVVMYRCIAMAIKTASKVSVFFMVVLFAVALAATGVIQSK